MKAELAPLGGKYYGTIVNITTDKGADHQITLWNTDDWEPSDRELEGICTIEQWRNNALLPTEPSRRYRRRYPSGLIPAKEAFELCDSHFESRDTYDLAVKIVELINGAQQQGTKDE